MRVIYTCLQMCTMFPNVQTHCTLQVTKSCILSIKCTMEYILRTINMFFTRNILEENLAENIKVLVS